MSDCYYDESGCVVCPAQNAQPFIPDRTELRAILGWNAGANSITMLDGGLHAVFDMPLGEIGVIIGLKGSRMKPAVPSLIEHGWFFQKVGSVDLVQPIEQGVPIGAPISGRTGTTVFEVRRVKGQITYRMDGTLVYTSSRPSVGAKVVNCCLYASGDSAPGGA
ncbi:MAG: hypothetical protein V4641_05570 [Pseudomonadota bacterium]